jgi:hypothetical protein
LGQSCLTPCQLSVQPGSEFSVSLALSGYQPQTVSVRPEAEGATAPPQLRPNPGDDDGFPIQVDGASTVIPGLYFVGVHFLRKRKSSLFIGVGEDASIIARDIARRKHPSNFA